jgi:O-antigen ligase
VPPQPDDHNADPAVDYAARQRSLADFRALPRRLKTHPAENAVLAVVGVHLLFLPWALGTMRPWAQAVSAGLAAIGFLLALVPRDYTREHTADEPFRLHPRSKLMRFPIFWLGLALVGYVALQGMNPAWAYRTDGSHWWMEAIPHRGWLPTGVTASFEAWNPWRLLLIYASAWLTVCTVWIGFTRRRTLRRLLVAVALNGAALALFGVLQQQLGNGKIFSVIASPSLFPFASFIYKNHAGTYLNLTLAVAAGLAAWYHRRGARRLQKSDPGVVFVFFAICIAGGVIASLARGATVAMLSFVLLGAAAYLIHQFRLARASRRPAVTVAMLIVFGGFLASGMFALRSRDVLGRLTKGITQQDTALAARQLATTAALEMLSDHWVRGVGAGSFRFLFTTYQARHLELLVSGGEQHYWEHAHNDLVEFPIELGLAGTLLLLVAGGCWAGLLVRARFWRNPLSVAVVAGILLTLAGAWWDFPFQCPAILITWGVLWAAATAWARFEETA